MFVWEGVSFYIPESAVDGTLRFVATQSAPQSSIVFDYFLRSALDSPGVVALNKRLSAMGEPIIFGLPDQERCQYVSSRGLDVATDIGVNELRQRYLPASLVDARQPSLNYLCTAVVPAKRR